MKRLYLTGTLGRMEQQIALLAPQHGFVLSPWESADIVMDFSRPEYLQRTLDCALSRGLPLVIGTTGYDAAQQNAIAQAAQHLPVFQSANFSPGIHALLCLVQKACAMLPTWNSALMEYHHREKRDAPSGTALKLMQCAPIDVVHAVRGGTICGIHEVKLMGQEEHLTLTHTAESRAVFAHGALDAASWLLKRPPGLYGMEQLFDVCAP